MTFNMDIVPCRLYVFADLPVLTTDEALNSFNVSHGEFSNLNGGKTFEEIYKCKQSFLVRSLAVPFPRYVLRLLNSDPSR